MTRPAVELSCSSGSGGAAVVQAVTVIMGVFVGLTFMFGFGNVLSLALRLGVPPWVAPLVGAGCRPLDSRAPPRHPTAGPGRDETCATAASRRLLIFASTVTLALNVAGPLVAGEYCKAAFDAVGPVAADRVGGGRPGSAQGLNHLTLAVRSNAR